MHRHVHGPVHGRLEHRVPRLQLPTAAGTSQHVTRTCASRSELFSLPVTAAPSSRPEVWQHGGLRGRGLYPGLLRPAQSQKRVRTCSSAGIWLAPLTCDLMRAGQ
ncbi:translocase of inner mitochondrial membrane 13 homolog (yeast) [Rattus norvegicus]|uniref:Translocase of inner mitochondrial membrane 13 homolog (Yeast) n=1 Tax=Rattus norvegicus TaxID=10116 RepID=A6K8E1_RAT|nr:translocase of inner mitochondrial membrane 13 homolog (yeast) [Rattus norvegicus]